MRFVDQYQALFFDMHGTFMFGHDRLGDGQDFVATYQRLGGRELTPVEVMSSVTRICAQLRRMYDDPAYFESFPTLRQAVAEYGGLEGRDEGRIEAVIASHEVGEVPDWAADTLRALAVSHPLALVSNLWAPPDMWLPVLERSGAARAFRCQIFSSSLGAIKPSPRPFLAALEAMGVEPSRVLFIGDSAERDIIPANRLGMASVHVGNVGQCPEATCSVHSITELLHLGI